MPGLGCSEFERPLMDMARRRLVDAPFVKHLSACEDCRAALERQIRLSAALGILANEAAHVAAPREVEQVVLTEAATVRRVRRRRFAWQVASGLLAASLTVAWWFGSRPAEKISVEKSFPQVVSVPHVAQIVITPVAKKRAGKTSKRASTPEEPFIAIPYTLPLDPFERAEVVRVDMPVAALIAAGLPVGMMDPAARAKTDVLIGQDGRARAVRLISVSNLN